MVSEKDSREHPSMTRHEAMKEIAELQLTFPIPPREGAEAVRAKEVGRRLHALWDYVFCEEPAPGGRLEAQRPGADRRGARTPYLALGARGVRRDRSCGCGFATFRGIGALKI